MKMRNFKAVIRDEHCPVGKGRIVAFRCRRWLTRSAAKALVREHHPKAQVVLVVKD
jgi:hypothetical protein